MTRQFTAIAIVAAHNEADIIAPVIGALIAEGLSVYLLDHASTDGTAEAAAGFLGRGLLAIEPFPRDRFPDARNAFAWAAILTRKQELAAELDADWFIHHDADEFRESPWEHLRLIDAIHRVDGFGYNAIDFELFNFTPTDDRFRPGDDPRTSFRFYEPGRRWDKAQVKCWKRQNAAVDLVSTGGHDVAFPGRRVFPLRFILRHYPIRGEAHGARKVFAERRPRFLPGEIDRGWHVQYGEIGEGQTFVRDPATLVEYDGDAVRLALVLGHRDREAIEASLAQASSAIAEQAETNTFLLAEVERVNAELRERAGDIARLASEQDRSREVIESLGGELRTSDARLRDRVSEVDRLTSELREYRAALAAGEAELRNRSAEVDELQSLVARLGLDIETQRREINALQGSKSWRWTRPLRAIHRRITRA